MQLRTYSTYTYSGSIFEGGGIFIIHELKIHYFIIILMKQNDSTLNNSGREIKHLNSPLHTRLVHTIHIRGVISMGNEVHEDSYYMLLAPV
jgi:hypothetical protein